MAEIVKRVLGKPIAILNKSIVLIINAQFFYSSSIKVKLHLWYYKLKMNILNIGIY